MMVTRLSSFGCTRPEHLLQRLQTTNEGKVTVGMQFVGPTTMAEAIVAIEASMDIQVFDCHVRKGFPTNFSVRFWINDQQPPDHDVRVTFRSTVQPKAKFHVKLEPSQYIEFINDLESSGLYEYESESPS